METFGQKLRQAIESRGLTLEEVARETGLDPFHLEALERDDHRSLPEDDSLMESLRELARLVDVDPDQVIDDYLEEREKYRETLSRDADAHRDAHVGPDVLMTSPASGSDGSPKLFALGAVVLVLAIGGLLWLRESAQADPVSHVEMPMTSERTPPPPEPRPAADDDGSPTVQRPAEELVPSLPAPSPPPEPSGLTIMHHGVGSGVENRRLIGEAERFPEGTSVWFWTQVEGGTPGDAIRHVWIREGEEILSVPLRIGGAPWRTHSYKGLHTGHAGPWVVEARDETGTVLARRAFECFEPTAD